MLGCQKLECPREKAEWGGTNDTVASQAKLKVPGSRNMRPPNSFTKPITYICIQMPYARYTSRGKGLLPMIFGIVCWYFPSHCNSPPDIPDKKRAHIRLVACWLLGTILQMRPIAAETQLQMAGSSNVEVISLWYEVMEVGHRIKNGNPRRLNKSDSDRMSSPLA